MEKSNAGAGWELGPEGQSAAWGLGWARAEFHLTKGASPAIIDRAFQKVTDAEAAGCGADPHLYEFLQGYGARITKWKADASGN